MPRREPKPKKIFKNLTIAVAGTLKKGVTNAQIETWVTLRAAKFSHDMNDSVTHLVCSEEDWKGRSPMVKAALARKGGKRNCCHIVTWDWLDLSCNKQKKEWEVDYAIDKKEKALGKKALEEKKKRAKEKKTDWEEETFINTEHFKAHVDEAGVKYEAILTRESGERYEMFLFKSVAQPPLYWFGAKFFKGKRAQPIPLRPSDCSGLFQREWTQFRQFFKLKTGVCWEQRFEQGLVTNEKARNGDNPTSACSGGTSSISSGDGSNPNAAASVAEQGWGASTGFQIALPAIPQTQMYYRYELPAGYKPAGCEMVHPVATATQGHDKTMRTPEHENMAEGILPPRDVAAPEEVNTPSENTALGTAAAEAGLSDADVAMTIVY